MTASGVLALKQMGYATYHIKSADLLAVIAGAGLFGVGMVLLGYCPGTGLAAIATGSLHALVGFLGMIAGGVIYALTFSWVRDHVLPVASLGKVRLTDLTGIGDWPWFAILAVVAILVFWIIERKPGRDLRAAPQA